MGFRYFSGYWNFKEPGVSQSHFGSGSFATEAEAKQAARDEWAKLKNKENKYIECGDLFLSEYGETRAAWDAAIDRYQREARQRAAQRRAEKRDAEKRADEMRAKKSADLQAVINKYFNGDPLSDSDHEALKEASGINSSWNTWLLEGAVMSCIERGRAKLP